MFEEFSGGYYLGRLYIQPGQTDQPVIHCQQHQQVSREFYPTDDSTALPLVMKIDNTHIAVHGDRGVPQDTLLLPESMLERTRIRNPPSLEEVLLAKPDYARQLLRFKGVSS